MVVAETATILGFSGHPLSGMWHIHLDNNDFIHVESGFGIRQIVECFGDLKRAIGKRIRYQTDWLNVLEWFEPLGEK